MSNENKSSKKTKIFSIVLVSVLVLSAIGIAGFFLYKKFSSSQEANPRPPSVQHQALKFSTNDDSVARAIQFDVGQADCGLVQISADNDFKTKNDNFNILIDVGVENSSSNAVKSELVNKIYNEFVTNIDLIVISHLHFDHIGAMETLLKDNRFNFKNTNILVNWAEAKYFGDKLSATAKRLFNTINEMNLTIHDSNYWANQTENKIIDFGENGYFSVLGGLDVSSSDQNAWSIVNRFEWKNNSILYTGDLAGKLNQQGIPININQKHYDQLNCDILKSPHHGSSTEESNGLDFLKKVNPKEVWISAGHSDKYTLPDVSALKNYQIVLPNNDVSLIKGTRYFGNNESKEPDKWVELNKFIEANPTINNNNQGYGDIKVILK